MSVRALTLLGCFLVSGATSLIYQIAWIDRFSLVLGSAAVALVAILSAFMAGLAVGAAAIGRLLPRIRRPLRVLAGLEIGVGVCALFVPVAIELASILQRSLLSASRGEAATVAAASFLSSFVVLVIPTSLMGATLPLGVRYLVRSDPQIGGRVGILYALNTLGAAAGTLVAAFYLLPRFGLSGTEWIAVSMNISVFAVVLSLDRLERPTETDPEARRPGIAGRAVPWILPLMFVAGVTAFAYELIWTRLLTHLVGGSLYAFATMLATVLVGTAIGSIIGGAVARRPVAARLGFVLMQIGVAVTALGAYYGLDRLPEIVSPTSTAWGRGLFLGWFYASLVLLPSSACSGACFPLAVRIVTGRANLASTAAARVFAWNTTGAIAGSVLTGLALLPEIGFWEVLKYAAIGNLVVALIAAWLSRPVPRALSVAALAGIVVLSLIPSWLPWELLRHRPIAGVRAAGKIRYFAVGRHGTVLLTEEARGWNLSTDGLPESRIEPSGAPLGLAPARWLSLLPVAVRPETRSLLVIGLGGGVMLESAPRTVETIEVIELESEILSANRSIGESRQRNPLSNDRVTITIDEARSHLALREKQYDAIASQPSHPWTSVSSHLFTTEFFSLVEKRLSDDGVFVQWIGLRFVDESLLRSLSASLQAVFDFVDVYQPPPGGALFFVASNRALAIERTGDRAIASAPDQWASLGAPVVEDLLIARILDSASVREFSRTAPLATDGHNRFRDRSPKVMSRSLGKDGAARLFAAYDSLPKISQGFDQGYIVRRLVRLGERARARLVAQSIAAPSTRRTAMAMIRITAGERRLGVRGLREALVVEPRSREALHNLVLSIRPSLIGASKVEDLVPNLSTMPARHVVEGWQAAARQDWESLEALDGVLAAIGPKDPLFSEATRLRVEWRLREGDEKEAKEALRLTDRLLVTGPRPSLLILRAECAAQASNPDAAIQSLLQLQSRVNLKARSDDLLPRARKIFEDLAGHSSTRGYGELEAMLAQPPG